MDACGFLYPCLLAFLYREVFFVVCLFVFSELQQAMPRTLPGVVGQDCSICSSCRQCSLQLAMPSTLLTVKQRIAIKGVYMSGMHDAFKARLITCNI